MGISASVTVYVSSGSVSGVTTAGPSVEGPEGICPERRGFLVVQFVPLIVGLLAPKALDDGRGSPSLRAGAHPARRLLPEEPLAVPPPLDYPQADHPLLRHQLHALLQRVAFPVLADS